MEGGGGTSTPYVISATGGTSTVVTADGSCISLTGDGSTSAPLTAAPVLDPDPDNALSCGPNGLMVTAPAGGGQAVAAACGLSGDGSEGSPLAAAVADWPYACDLDDQGGLVYCDSTGVLRSEPRGRVVVIADAENTAVPATPVPTGSDVPVLERTLTIDNPDPCREAVALIHQDMDIDITLPAESGGGTGFGPDDMTFVANRGNFGIPSTHTQVTRVVTRTIPPGGQHVETLVLTMGRGSGGSTYSRLQWAMTAFVVVV
ncbi:hypothetical protein GCM10020227_10980 [Streptomyces flavovirens]